jgi:predicted MFS family arabinose efflux permease
METQLSPPASALQQLNRYLPVALLLCASFVIDGSAYGTLAPLLPTYRSDIGLSVDSAGILTGTFSAAMLPASIIILVFGRRVSSKWLAVSGLAMIGLGAVVTAAADSVATLMLARALQGLGAGTMFAGGLRWLLAIVPPSRRATWFGLSWGAMNGGTVLGPAVGGLAVRYGLAKVQIAFALIAALVALSLFLAHRPADVNERPASVSPRSRLVPLAGPLTLYAAPAIAIGMANTLSPLRMSDLGASHDLIAVVFLIAGAVSVCVSPLTGRWVDHAGPGRPLLTGLLLGTGLALVLAFCESRIVIAVGTIALLGLAGELAAIPASTVLDTAGSANGLQFASTTLVPIVYAVFETIGAFVSGPLSGLTLSLPFLLLAATYLATAIFPRLTISQA